MNCSADECGEDTGPPFIYIVSAEQVEACREEWERARSLPGYILHYKTLPLPTIIPVMPLWSKPDSGVHYPQGDS